MRSETCKITIAALMTWLFWPLINAVCLAGEADTLIVHPKTKEPVQRIYSAIIEGIQQTIRNSETLVLADDIQPVELSATLQRINPETIIALSRMAAEKVVQSGYRDRMIVAGALFDPDEYSGVSLAIDSRSLVKEIQSILPFIQRIFILDSPTRASIKVYPESLYGSPSIITQYHEDPLISTRQLWQLLNQETSINDAIILPSQLDREILYELTQRAWQKKIILLSTNLAQLKEGVLMVFYPDNVEMGRQIGAFSIEHQDQVFESLSQIQVALNPTVARHLGLEFAPDVSTRFKLQVK